MSIRGFIYFIELAVAVGIVYALIRILGALFNFNPAGAIEGGMMDEMIEDKIDERINQGMSLPNPLEILDYYWWNYFKPLI